MIDSNSIAPIPMIEADSIVVKDDGSSDSDSVDETVSQDVTPSSFTTTEQKGSS